MDFETLPTYWGEEFYLCWSTELIDAINELATTEGVELVWATTWRHLAPSLFSPTVGVKGHDWRVLHATRERIKQKETWWKQELIMKDLKENPTEKFVWVDDELIKNPDAIRWANTMVGSKVVIPSLNTGLTRNQWDDIVSHLGC